MAASEMLGEWLAPVRRWIQFLMRPLVVIFLVEAVVKFKTQGVGDPRGMNLALYLGVSLLAVWIYPTLAQWSCLWIGLRIRNQMRALITSLLLVVAWCIIPLVISSYLMQIGLLTPGSGELLNFVSPISVIATAEAIGRTASDTWVTWNMIVMAFAQLGLAAALMWWLRRLCLTNANRYLGRI